MIIEKILFVLWFFLPSGVANTAPIVAAKLPILSEWSAPLDFGLTFRGKRLFGDHKTIRGIIVGMISGIATVMLQQYIYATNQWVHSFVPVDYTALPILTFGLLVSIGPLAGDLVKSFFKRQMGFSPGASWVPFDQLDYIVGAIVATAFVVPLSFIEYVLSIIVWFLIHPVATAIGFATGLRTGSGSTDEKS